MISRLLWVIYLLRLLTQITNARCFIADDENRIFTENLNIFTMLHGMQTWYSDEKAVRPSVCQTREL